MSATRMSRTIPTVRRMFNVGSRPCSRLHGAFLMRPQYPIRRFFRPRDGRDPFNQMESFMRDMERKFKTDIDHAFRDLPRMMESGFRPGLVEVKPKARFGDVADKSTAEMYKLSFNFPNAKPEDVKVTLKGRTLTVEGSVEEVTESSKCSQQMSYSYEVPEDVNIDSLESSITEEGVLIIDAPRIPVEKEGPTKINIQRE